MAKIVKSALIIKQRKNKWDTVAKSSTLFFGILFWVLFIGVIAFIIYGSIPGWKAYGFANIFGTSTYDLEKGKAGVWLPLCVTILVSGFAILIGGPIGIKTAFFIQFRIPRSKRKYVKMGFEFLADIPSVVYGLFSMTMLGPVIQVIFHTPTSTNLITCGFMLAFMITPTVISMTLAALDSVDDSLLFMPEVMGNSKTKAIYKVYKREIKGKIIIALITALSRALDETMGVSMILQSQNFNHVFSNGFIAIWTSYLKTLGCVISSNMLASGATDSLKGLLFAYGLFLLVFVIFINAIIKIIFRKKKSVKQSKFSYAIYTTLAFIPRQVVKLWNKITNRNVIHINSSNIEQLPLYFNQRANKENTQVKIYDGWKLFWEVLCFTLTMGFAVWMFITLIVRGIMACGSGYSTIFQFGKDTTGQAVVNTLLMIILSVGIGIIISIAVAIYLNEFCKEGKFKKTFVFFIDSLGATPSIIYGMFGLIFFLQLLGISSAGNSGKSLMASSLTLIFVILPALTRQTMGALQVIPQDAKLASYALGVSKVRTIKQIVLPAAFQHIITSVVLSIGRVLAETAPVYLTAGLSGGSKISYMSPGQTLTTRIYAQLGSNNVVKAQNIMYECAFVAVILIILILVTVDIAIPKYFEYKKSKKSKTPIIIIGDNEKIETSKKEKFNSTIDRIKTNFQEFYNLNLRY